MANFRKFRLPQLLQRSTETVKIPQFDFNKLVVKERISQGSFGDVFTAMFKAPNSEETETVVVKKNYLCPGPRREKTVLERSCHSTWIELYQCCRIQGSVRQTTGYDAGIRLL